MYGAKSTQYELHLQLPEINVRSKLELLMYDTNKKDHYKITVRH